MGMGGLRHNCVTMMGLWKGFLYFPFFTGRGIPLLKLHNPWSYKTKSGWVNLRKTVRVQYNYSALLKVVKCHNLRSRKAFFADSSTDLNSGASRKLIVANSGVGCWNATNKVAWFWSIIILLHDRKSSHCRKPNEQKRITDTIHGKRCNWNIDRSMTLNQTDFFPINRGIDE